MYVLLPLHFFLLLFHCENDRFPFFIAKEKLLRVNDSEKREKKITLLFVIEVPSMGDPEALNGEV